MTNDYERHDDGQAFVETSCPFTHNGQTFTAGGAWLMRRRDTGRLEGLLYAYGDSAVGDWQGQHRYPATFGRPFRSNLGDLRRCVWFRIDGRDFFGVQYGMEWSEVVRVRECAGSSVRTSLPYIQAQAYQRALNARLTAHSERGI
jgi:hypothetical protein